MSLLASLPTETQAFLGLIGLLALLFHLRYGEKTVAYGPTILTTVGIFATFFAITKGLSTFNPKEIQQSVPDLLDGLKTAFWASVAGVGGALTLKLRHYFGGELRDAESPSAGDGVTISDLAKLLAKIHQALVGDGDATLVSQVRLARQDSNDRLDGLKKVQAQTLQKLSDLDSRKLVAALGQDIKERLDGLKKAQLEALQKLSEMGSKALIEGLRDVIRDFNQRITEQFGDNFKQLNAAVGRLLVWQEQYKAHIEATTERHNQVLASMQAASEHYAALVEKASDFADIAEDLSELLDALETQKKELRSNLDALGRLLKEASGGLPAIEAKIMELTGQLSKAVLQNQEQVTRALQENSRTIREQSQQAISAVTEVSKQSVETSSQAKALVEKLQTDLADALVKSLNTFGEQMAALSERFAKDYGPLAERLREIVELPRRAQ